MKNRYLKIIPVSILFVFLIATLTLCFINVNAAETKFDSSKFPVSDGSTYNICTSCVDGSYHYVYYSSLYLLKGERVALYLSVVNNKTIVNVYGSEFGYNHYYDYYYDGEYVSSYTNTDYGQGYTHTGSYGLLPSSFPQLDIMYSDLYIFNDEDSARAYVDNGTLDNVYQEPTKNVEYNADIIAFTDFQMIIHDSNSYDDYYIEFLYSPTDYLLSNNGSVTVTGEYDYNLRIASGLFDVDSFVPQFNSFTFDISEHPNSIKVYLKDVIDLSNIPSAFHLGNLDKRLILGKEGLIDTSGLSIDGIGMESVIQVTQSCLYFTFSPFVQSIEGLRYDSFVDILDASNSYSSSLSPTASDSITSSDGAGDYVSNNDFNLVDGYYFTNVVTDASGNNKYTYYYFDCDGNKLEISADDNVNNTFSPDIGSGGGGGGSSVVGGGNVTINNNPTINVGSGSSSGNNLKIEDDDFSDEELRKDLADGFGLFDDVETPEGGDGFLSLLKDFFSVIDPDLNEILAFSITMICGLGIIFVIFKR